MSSETGPPFAVLDSKSQLICLGRENSLRNGLQMQSKYVYSCMASSWTTTFKLWSSVVLDSLS